LYIRALAAFTIHLGQGKVNRTCKAPIRWIGYRPDRKKLSELQITIGMEALENMLANIFSPLSRPATYSSIFAALPLEEESDLYFAAFSTTPFH
jgi:hypothetical protein